MNIIIIIIIIIIIMPLLRFTDEKHYVTMTEPKPEA